MLFSPALYEVGFAALAGLPYLKHGLDLFLARNRVLLRPEQTFHGSLTILLPVWNEAKILEQKLENLVETCQDFRPKLVIIDSASTDDSVSIIERWNGKDSFPSFQLLRMDERKGKTAAVKLALEHINHSHKSDLILMTDADALFESNTVSNLLKWFSDSSIGCVGATPKRIGQRMEEAGHRSMFSMVRTFESRS